MADGTHQEQITVAAAIGGDTDAYKKLYQQHIAMVYGLALRLVNEPSAAEEVAQDTFIRAWKSLPSFKGDSRLSTWLHQITSRAAVDYLRRHRQWRLGRADSDQLADIGDEIASSPDQVDLNAMLKRLPERTRLVFVLHAIEGYRHEQIARLTGMAVGSSKAQFNRAKTLIQEWLSSD